MAVFQALGYYGKYYILSGISVHKPSVNELFNRINRY